MNPEIKKKWVDALRSGKYTQGRGYLRDENNRFCCLGVLCDVLAPEGWTETVEDPDYDGDEYRGYYAFIEQLPEACNHEEVKYTTHLPHGIRKVCEVENQFAAQDQLIDMNDEKRASFHEIADWIEENL